MVQHGSLPSGTDPYWSEEIDRAELGHIERTFLHHHRLRLDEAKARLTPTRRDVLEALPVLLQFNHPLLPGFGGHAVPAGIDHYVPSARGLRAVAQFTQLTHDRLKRQPDQILGRRDHSATDPFDAQIDVSDVAYLAAPVLVAA